MLDSERPFSVKTELRTDGVQEEVVVQPTTALPRGNSRAFATVQAVIADQPQTITSF